MTTHTTKSETCPTCGLITRGPLNVALSNAMRLRGMARVDMATASGFSESAIGAYEHGKRTMSLEVIARLERALDLPRGGLLVAAGAVDRAYVTAALIEAADRVADEPPATDAGGAEAVEAEAVMEGSTTT